MVTKKTPAKTLAIDELVGKPKEQVAAASNAVNSDKKEATSDNARLVDSKTQVDSTKDEQSTDATVESASHSSRSHSERFDRDEEAPARPHRIHIGSERNNDSNQQQSYGGNNGYYQNQQNT